MRLDRLVIGNFFELFGNYFIHLGDCRRHIGWVNIVQFNAPGIKCVAGEVEVRYVTRVKITEE